MNTTQRIFDKLAKIKGNGSRAALGKKNKVELSVIDDLNSELNWLEEITGTASYYESERFEELENEWSELKMKFDEELDNLAVNSGVGGIEEVADRVLEYLEQISKSAEGLGVEPSEIYDRYDEVKEIAENSKDLYSDFRDKYKELVRWGGFNDFL